MTDVTIEPTPDAVVRIKVGALIREVPADWHNAGDGTPWYDVIISAIASQILQRDRQLSRQSETIARQAREIQQLERVICEYESGALKA